MPFECPTDQLLLQRDSSDTIISQLPINHGEEKRKAQGVLLLLTENGDGSVKGRACHNGVPTRAWLEKENSASPTASTESVTLLAALDASEGSDVMTVDVPNAFVQTPMPEAKI